MAENNTVSSSSRSSSDSDLSCKLGAVGGEHLEMTDGNCKQEASMASCLVENMKSVSSSETMEDGINRLLQKHKNEIMFELRRLKNGDRPVTGQENKKNVEDFFRNQLDPSYESNQSEQHRPEEVIVEVQGLVQSRPVSSLLQSARFRRSLENAIRGGLNSVSTGISSSSTVQTQSTASASSQPSRVNVPAAPPIQQDALSNIRARRSSQNTSSAEVNRRDLLRSIRERRPQMQATPQIAENHGQEQISRASESQASERVSPPLAPEVPAPIRAQAWLQQVPNIDPREQQHVTVWDSIEQAQRESVIMEISELIQSQLVTQALDGGFRTTLEARMRDHLDSSGTDGRRVQSFIQSLPPTPHVRNDFSELGIQGARAPSGSDNLDNVSVISATAAVQVQQSQQQMLMSREMQSLKAQMQEMKNMMRMSFDMQMDIQRAIRQEVAAAMACAASSEAPRSTDQSRTSQSVDDGQCLICLDANADSVLYQCGHLCLCYTCGLQLRQRGSNCPVCRAPIKDIIRAFKSGHTK